jgi:dihydrolipoamide dehydrogenase
MEPYEVIVIGGGPGGYVAAIRCAQLGLPTALIEREHLGGVCLNWGCIPTKALLRSVEVVSLLQQGQEFGITCDNFQVSYRVAVQRSRKVVDRLVKGVAGLLKKNRVEVIEGEGRLVGPREVEVRPTGIRLQARNVILATGARPRSIPGVEIDRQQVITSREALVLEKVPETLVIIGAGAIGVEFADIFQTYGSRVTLVEMLPHLLPAGDSEIGEELERSFRRRKIKVLTGTRVEGLSRQGGRVRISVSGPQGRAELEAEKVLVAVGVAANTEALGLEAVGVETEGGFIRVDSRMATNVPGLYAIGDVTGPPLLAHVASHQGLLAAEALAGREVEPFSPEEVPYATYCHPQVASVGLTEEQARQRGYAVRVGRFPFRGCGKAIALGDYEGLVKLVADAATGQLLGGHLIGPEATELLPELVLAKRLKATVSDLAGALHAHPTLSEALREAALAVSGEALHI